MKAALIVLSCLIAGAFCAPKNDLTCSICVDIVTDLDNFITSDTTEQQIVEFVEQVFWLTFYISPQITLFSDLLSSWCHSS